MADKKISQLSTASTPLAGTESVPMVQSGSTVRASVSDLTAGRTVDAGKFQPTANTVTGNGMYAPAANTVAFSTAGAEAVRINATQQVGIGGAPSQRLHLIGGTYRQNDATNSFGFELQNGTGTSRLVTISGGSAFAIQTGNNGKDYLNLDGNGNVTTGDNNLTTTSTNGFFYAPTCAGVPTGTPTAKTGFAPVVIDTTNHRLYFFSGGSWRNAGP